MYFKYFLVFLSSVFMKPTTLIPQTEKFISPDNVTNFKNFEHVKINSMSINLKTSPNRHFLAVLSQRVDLVTFKIY